MKLRKMSRKRMGTLAFAGAVVLIFLCGLVAVLGHSDGEPPKLDVEVIPAETFLPVPATEEMVEITIPPTEAPAEPPALTDEPGDYIESFFGDSTEYVMDYYVHIPEGAVQGMPLIVFLHGENNVGDIKSLREYGMISQAKAIYGSRAPFIAISPCTWTASWTADDISVTLKELIDFVADKYCVDKSRIIITGYGMGALGVWHMINVYGNYFSAAVPISGKAKVVDAANCANVPLWAFAGDLDAKSAAKYEESNQYHMERAIARINEVGGNGVLSVVLGYDHTDMLTIPYSVELFDWMLKQQ